MKLKKQANEENLPAVSKQTAGGITGAVIGGLLGGPVGAVAGGVAGALVGNSSAKGNKPIKKTVDSIQSHCAEGNEQRPTRIEKLLQTRRKCQRQRRDRRQRRAPAVKTAQPEGEAHD